MANGIRATDAVDVRLRHLAGPVGVAVGKVAVDKDAVAHTEHRYARNRLIAHGAVVPLGGRPVQTDELRVTSPDMSFPWDTVASVFSAAAAGGALLAAGRANQTAEAVARIERERRHEELTPQFDIDFRELTNHWSGPLLPQRSRRPRPPRRSHDHHRRRRHGPHRAQSWPRAHAGHGRRPRVGAVPLHPPQRPGRRQRAQGGAVPLPGRPGRPLSMERTRPGHWTEGQTQALWQQGYADQPIRLRMVCRRGDEEWVIARRVENPPAPAAA